MSKKIVKAIAATLAAISLTAFTACQQTSGNNAYDLAVQNGHFSGTLEEWLRSLHGKNGEDGEDLDIEEIYDAAVRNGYEKDFLTFLKEYLSVEVQEDNDTATIAQNVTSVVSIYASFEKTVRGSIFGGVPSETTRYNAAGSGVIVDLNKQTGNAYIVTNYHVVYDSECNTATGISDSIWLYLYGSLNGFSTTTGEDVGGDGIRATFVGGSMDYDIAVLKVEGSEYLQQSVATAAELGDSNEVTIGEKVFVVGNPEGEGISVTSGVVSVDSEYIAMTSSDGKRVVEYRVMRTDAAINHGNSGGAMFDASGKLIGITNAKSTAEDVDNMGYALPITQVKYVMENAVENGGALKRAMLGITVATTDTTVRLDEEGRLVIEEELTVAEAPTAGTAGYGLLKQNDILKSATIDGVTTELGRRFYLIDLLLQVRKGDTISLTIERGGEEMQVEVVFDKDGYFTTYA